MTVSDARALGDFPTLNALPSAYNTYDAHAHAACIFISGVQSARQAHHGQVGKISEAKGCL
jgi:hypothetical protein